MQNPYSVGGDKKKSLSSTEKVDDRGADQIMGRSQHDEEEKASWSKQKLSPSISHPTPIPILFLLFVMCEHMHMCDCARPDPRAEVRRQFW